MTPDEKVDGENPRAYSGRTRMTVLFPGSEIHVDTDIGHLVDEFFTKNVMDQWSQVSRPAEESYPLDKVDDAVMAYLEHKGYEVAMPHADNHQEGGFSRTYISVKRVPDPSKRYGISNKMSFVKAILRGLPGALKEEGNIQRYVSEKTGVAPDVEDISEIKTGTGRTIGIVVQELVNGKNLKKYLKDGGIPMSRKLRLIKQAADLVGKVHEAGYAHRDIKPANFMVVGDEVKKVIDFGTAAKPGDVQRGNVVACTPEYMSPEHLTNKIDHRMDIFSFGCSGYEIILGKSPLVPILESYHNKPDDSISDTAAKDLSVRIYDAMMSEEHIKKLPDDVKKSVEGVSRDIVEIFNRCMRKDPDKRYQNCAELAADLGKVIERESLIEGALDLMRKGDTEIWDDHAEDIDSLSEDDKALIGLVEQELKGPDCDVFSAGQCSSEEKQPGQADGNAGPKKTQLLWTEPKK